MSRLGRVLTGSLIAICLYQISQGQAASNAPAKHVEIASVPARPEDVSTLEGIMKAYYETGNGPAGQPRQWARDSTPYVPTCDS